MTRRLGGVAVAVLLACAAPTALAQSPYAWIGGAATMPMGDSKDALKTGWLLDVGVGRPLMGSQKWSIQAGGLYGSNSAKVGSGETSLLAGMVNVLVGTPSERKTGGYVYAGGGMLRAKPDVGDSETKGAFQVGGGLSRSLNASHSLWAEVRYLSSGSGNTKLTLLPITVGVTHTFGSN